MALAGCGPTSRAPLQFRVPTTLPRETCQQMRAPESVADRVGFEPTVRFHVRRFSRPLP